MNPVRVDLDQDLVAKIKGLTVTYGVEPQPGLLIPIPNRFPENIYMVDITTSEFTSLCPLHTAQPDYATIGIEYTPGESLVELKSLKLYLVSYRQCPVFHEEICNLILNDLVEAIEPLEMHIKGIFTTRGGLDTTVHSHYTRPLSPEEIEAYKRQVDVG